MSLLLARPRFKRNGCVVHETAPRAVAFAVLREIRLEQLRWRATFGTSTSTLDPPMRARLRDRVDSKLSVIASVAISVREAIDRELR